MALKEICKQGREGAAVGVHLQNETVGAEDPAFPLHAFLREVLSITSMCKNEEICSLFVYFVSCPV